VGLRASSNKAFKLTAPLGTARSRLKAVPRARVRSHRPRSLRPVLDGLLESGAPQEASPSASWLVRCDGIVH
jgi:hypothetical protein